MPQGQCPLHAVNECPVVVEGAGTYCRESGVELWGPMLVQYDLTSVGLTESSRSSECSLKRKRRNSIAKRVRGAQTEDKYFYAFNLLYSAASAKRKQIYVHTREKLARRVRIGRKAVSLIDVMRLTRPVAHVSVGIHDTMCINLLVSLIAKFGAAVTEPRETYASCRMHALVLTATVMDTMARGMDCTDGREYIPKLQIAVEHKLSSDAFKMIGISCRAISKMSRRIRECARLGLAVDWAADVRAAERVWSRPRDS